jgi:hypothetical protein
VHGSTTLRHSFYKSRLHEKSKEKESKEKNKNKKNHIPIIVGDRCGIG